MGEDEAAVSQASQAGSGARTATPWRSHRPPRVSANPGTGTGMVGRRSAAPSALVNSALVTGVGGGEVHRPGEPGSVEDAQGGEQPVLGRRSTTSTACPMPSGAPSPILKMGSILPSAAVASAQHQPGAQLRDPDARLLGRPGLGLPPLAQIAAGTRCPCRARLVDRPVTGVAVEADRRSRTPAPRAAATAAASAPTSAGCPRRGCGRPRSCSPRSSAGRRSAPRPGGRRRARPPAPPGRRTPSAGCQNASSPPRGSRRTKVTTRSPAPRSAATRGVPSSPEAPVTMIVMRTTLRRGRPKAGDAAVRAPGPSAHLSRRVGGTPLRQAQLGLEAALLQATLDRGQEAGGVGAVDQAVVVASARGRPSSGPR